MQWDNTTIFTDPTDEERTFRAQVREWIAANCPPEVRNRTNRITAAEMKTWHRRLYERGWIAPDWPVEHGGMGATLTQQIILFEEMFHAGAEPPFPHGLNFIGPIIIRVGTLAQKRRFLPDIVSGDAIWCQGYSEPDAGSDLASLRTRADLVGDTFVVNGRKVWTTNGGEADWMFALVRTNPKATPKHAGLSILLIDLRSPGVTVRPITTIKGDAEFAEETFENVQVPAENLLGPLNGGWALATQLLGAERILTANPGPMGRILNHALFAANASGAIDDPSFRSRLADLEIDLLSLVSYYKMAGQLNGSGKVPLATPGVLKLASGEFLLKSAELLMQALGAHGPSWRDTKSGSDQFNALISLLEARRLSIGGGSSEI